MEEQRKYQTHIITCMIILAILFLAAILSNQTPTNRMTGNSIWEQNKTDTITNFDNFGNRIDVTFSSLNSQPENRTAVNG